MSPACSFLLYALLTTSSAALPPVLRLCRLQCGESPTHRRRPNPIMLWRLRRRWVLRTPEEEMGASDSTILGPSNPWKDQPAPSAANLIFSIRILQFAIPSVLQTPGLSTTARSDLPTFQPTNL